MVKAILFDFWGTLVEQGVQSPLRQVKYMLGLERMGFSKFVTMFESVFMTKKFENLDTAFKEVCKFFNTRYNFKLLNDLVGLWNKNWMLAKPYDDTMEGLEWLKDKGLKIGLISNTDSVSVENVMNKFDLSSNFDTIVLSYQCGMLKSNPKMFDLAAEKLGVNKEDILMVGDSLISDIEAAKNAGVKAILMDRKDRRAVEEKLLNIFDLEKFL